MRKKSLHYLILIAVMGAGLASCRSDVTLDNMSVDGQVNAKLSLPVGELTTSFSKMMGLFGQDAKIIVNEQGLLEMMIDEHHVRDFHQIELKDYIGKINENADIPGGASTIYKNTQVDLPFPLTIHFDGVNNDLVEERLDSMVIDLARFTTRITPINLNISDGDIQKVTMKFGPQFRRAKGTEIVLPDFHLGSDVPIEIDDFSLVMMKDVKADPGNTNVINTAEITFVLTLKTGQDVVVSSSSKLNFLFEVEMMSYNALYGYFRPGEETKDSSVLEVPISMPGNYPFVMPAKEPEITLAFTYGMSMPLEVYFNYIKAIHSDGTETFATWDGSKTTTETLRNILPVDAPLNDSAQSSIILNKSANSGAVDRFFEKEVTDMAYNYELMINKTEADKKGMKQFRLTKNTNFVMDFHFKMPFNFKKGLDATYADTIRDIQLEKASLDSLAAMSGGIITKIDTAELALYLVITNEIPVQLLLDIEFLDENDQVLPITPLKNVKIAPAEMKSLTDITPTASTATMNIHTKDFDHLSKTRSMRMLIHMGDDQKESAFPANKKLSIKIGVTGDIQAALSLELGKNNNKKNK